MAGNSGSSSRSVSAGNPDAAGSRPPTPCRSPNACSTTPGLRLLGVMGVAPLDDEPRPAFERLRAVSDDIRALAPEATAISAGMSGDFREAILEGATHLRIGTAITGKRPTPG